MSAKKQTRRRTVAETDAPVVLDVEIHFSTHLTQHVAVPYVTDTPLADWTTADLTGACERVANLLPVRDALGVSSVMWSESEGLRVSLGSIRDGNCPFLEFHVLGCSQTTAIRCLGATPFMLSSMHYKGDWRIREAVPHTPDGVKLAASTVRDDYAHDDRESSFEIEMQKKDADRLAAVQAARRAAGLPLVPAPKKRGKAA